MPCCLNVTQLEKLKTTEPQKFDTCRFKSRIWKSAQHIGVAGQRQVALSPKFCADRRELDCCTWKANLQSDTA